MPTKITCTIDKGGTGNYAGWASANSDNYGASGTDFMTQNEDVDVTLINTGTDVDVVGSITLNFDTDATRNLTIECDSDYRHKGNYPGAVNRYRCQVSDHGINIASPFTTIDGAAFRHSTTANNRFACYINGSAGCRITRCVCYHYAGTHTGLAAFATWAISTGQTAQIDNCISYTYPYSSSMGFYIAGGDGGGLVEILNCTSNDMYYGVLRGSGKTPCTPKNCLVMTSTGNSFVGTFTGALNNAYFKGSDPGTSGVDLSELAAGDVFYDESNDDFHLAKASVCRAAGVDLSSQFTTDVEGETRSAWDIGAHEYKSIEQRYSRRPRGEISPMLRVRRRIK